MKIKLSRATVRVLRRIKDNCFDSEKAYNKAINIRKFDQKIQKDESSFVDIKHAKNVASFAHQYVWNGDVKASKEEIRSIELLKDFLS